MSKRKETATEKAVKVEATKAEAALRKATVQIFKNGGFPKDLIERTREVHGTPFQYKEAFAKLSNADRATLRQAFKELADFPNGEFDKLTGAGDGGDGRPTQANQLISIAEGGCTLFHDSGDAFAEIENAGHCETWPVRPGGFREWLQLRYFKEHGGAPNNEALQSAEGTIKARARFEGPERKVYRRVGTANGSLYLDLCDPAWRAIEVDAKGWRIVDRPPVPFIRSRTMRELPEPTRGGHIDDLRQLLNDLRQLLNLAADGDFILAVAWVLAALRDEGPYPVLVLTGEQGSAKSTCARMLRALVDPCQAPLRSVPRNEQDLFIAARNGHVLAFDNLGGVPTWLSDALCRLSTGGGFAARELYTDDEEVVISAERPLILNGIDEVVARGDLADRAIFLTLSAIREADRKPEAKLWARFEEARPRILGALLDALVEGVRRLPDVRLDRLPRMADFAKWVVACESAIFPDGAFMRAYRGNRDDAIESVIDANPVASAIRELMQSRESWEGTATELLTELEGTAGGTVTKGKGREWPTSGRSLGRRLNRPSSALRPVGIEIDGRKSGSKRLITISRRSEDGRNETSQTSQTSQTPYMAGHDEGHVGGPVGHVGHVEGHDQGHVEPSPGAAGDVWDVWDKKKRPLSGNGKEVPAELPGEPTAGEAYRRRSDGE